MISFEGELELFDFSFEEFEFESQLVVERVLGCGCNLSNLHAVLDGSGGQSFSYSVVVDKEFILEIFEAEVEVGQSYEVLIDNF